LEANEIKVVVSAEEIEAAKQEAEVSKIKGDADADLAVALPALENAVKKVKEINVNDFYELKAVNTPGPSIVACFQVACFLILKMRNRRNRLIQEKIPYDPDGWFELSKQKLLSEPKALQDMINYDKDNIADALIAKIKPMMEKRKELSEKKVQSASGVCGR
jgi:dynein heavy chain